MKALFGAKQLEKEQVQLALRLQYSLTRSVNGKCKDNKTNANVLSIYFFKVTIWCELPPLAFFIFIVVFLLSHGPSYSSGFQVNQGIKHTTKDAQTVIYKYTRNVGEIETFMHGFMYKSFAGIFFFT